MRRRRRVFRATLAILTVATTVLAGHAGAAGPVVDLDGSTHVLTFTSPPVYDVSVHTSYSEGGITNETAILQDQNGNIKGAIADLGSNVALTTTITGTIRRSGGVTVIKEKQLGDGDLGNGDKMFAKGTTVGTVIDQPGGTPTLHTVLRIKTCAFFKKPFSDKYSKVCNSGGGEHDAPFPHSGDWIVRLDLEQSPSGELFGFGKIITNVHSAQFKRETDVIIEGLAKDEGLAKIKLSPLFPGGDGPISMVAQINGFQHPAVLFVISVKGKLLGQKFSEEFATIGD